MLRRLAALRLRTRVALTAGLVSVPVAVVVVVLLAGRDADDRFCTLMAGFSGVSVSVPIPGLKAKADAFQRRAVRDGTIHRISRFDGRLDRYLQSSLGIRGVVLCVDGRCGTHRLSGMRVIAPAAAVRADGPRRVQVVVAIDRPARPLQVATGAVRLTRNEPNGPGCGTWWRGEGRVVGDRVES
ncbi:MAG TPA: hypothetical protein VGM33_15190 [Baekduia sp.]|jgi:hypothetical protein